MAATLVQWRIVLLVGEGSEMHGTWGRMNVFAWSGEVVKLEGYKNEVYFQIQ
jgi:hypothetical protein